MDQFGIVHFFSYPRSPKQNSHIERFNRTLQEEFVDANTNLLPDLNTFNNRLVDYLLFYNTERPHQALRYLSPMARVVQYLHQSDMYATNTRRCNDYEILLVYYWVLLGVLAVGGLAYLAKLGMAERPPIRSRCDL